LDDRIVFMFSGQGSQYYQMGRELYQKNGIFRFWMDQCNELASPLLGRSMIGVLFSTIDKSKPFDDILFSNPCLLALEYSLARTLMESGLEPEYLLGYSLGEIAAAAVAETITLEEALGLAIGIADLAEEKTPLTKMLAVLDLGKDLENSLPLPPECWITAKNFRGNVVVCGAPEGIDELRRKMQSQGRIVQELPVRQGFHTKRIDSIEADVKNLARSLRPHLKSPRFPVVSCLKGGFIERIDAQYVWDVIRGEIDFPGTIRRLEAEGGFQFIDVGPSGTLATFVKYLLPPGSRSASWQSLSPFGRDESSVAKLLAHFSGRRTRQPA
jgi:bacillaene synthase trans-acting acyltransferase